MLSRGAVGRNYRVSAPGMVRAPGYQRITADGSQSYAISRPSNSPSPEGAPQYMHTYPALPAPQHNRRAMTGGTTPLSLRSRVGQATNRRSGG